MANGIEMAKVKIEGVSPLLMHNAHLADPLNNWAQKMKAITSKPSKKRTEADAAELVESEFQGGLYFCDSMGPFVPSVNIESCIREGGTINRLGKDVQSGTVVDPDQIKLIYDGPRDRKGLFADKRFVDYRPVKLKKSDSLMRTRPRFDKWALEFEVSVFIEVISLTAIEKALRIAGARKGLGDYRPKFGRFLVVMFKRT